ncbi:hypothetical protein [Arthrobacter sp. ISL-65]|uniref:hypothetical protein n=1 Tax=Arthrobacter sp. ISL-65 TaxID=2819112 RepID=UPI001BE957D4|nr:hypothetical protein [Arthrobacter sp. ISL-65]MBT2548041.1 hypothetical protein [Arthrobacter sp. ISL-65]
MGDTSGRPPPAGSNFAPGTKVKSGLVSRRSPGWSSPPKAARETGQQRRWKGSLRTGGLHRRLPAGLERWQVVGVLDVAEVGEQSLLGMPVVLGQVPEQGQAYSRIEVRVSEDPADQLLELKLQKPAPSCLAWGGWLSRSRHCGRSGAPLLMVGRR